MKTSFKIETYKCVSSIKRLHLREEKEKNLALFTLSDRDTWLNNLAKRKAKNENLDPFSRYHGVIVYFRKLSMVYVMLCHINKKTPVVAKG